MKSNQDNYIRELNTNQDFKRVGEENKARYFSMQSEDTQK